MAIVPKITKVSFHLCQISENVLIHLCLHCKEMALDVFSSHHVNRSNTPGEKLTIWEVYSSFTRYPRLSQRLLCYSDFDTFYITPPRVSELLLIEIGCPRLQKHKNGPKLSTVHFYSYCS